MVDQNEEYVALFIDWDNLAISIAADLSGATPDVKRIVQTAQNYGTILVARAYAEWNSTSDRLNVYRYGVEPVYAPTFRFEADPITQAARGKSLADPCMVADCVDILHLHPKITTFVIVSGDKDLIPVVRLAQLRGKHVVVIGPDYAASVLREIADEFISYRTVIEAGNGKPSEAGVVDIAKGVRRHTPVRMPQPPQLGSARRPRSAASTQPSQKTKLRDIASNDQQPESIIQQTVLDAPDLSKVDIASEKDASYDLSAVIAAMVDILKQRTGEGKERLRATNLKDALMVKLPGFSERRYGFAKFKDFLLAAEKTGVITVSVAGPVHWVSLPATSDAAGSYTSQQGSTGASEDPAAAAVQEQQAAGESADVTALTEDRYEDIVRFIIDLRGRSRWLTYTYVLTNLISYLGRLLPQADAESSARSTLNRLVQEGILRIDREPQEVEVGGIKHRVRMCHVDPSHPFVAQMLSEIGQEEQQPEPALTTPQAEEQGPRAESEGPEFQQAERYEETGADETSADEVTTSLERSEVAKPETESEGAQEDEVADIIDRVREIPRIAEALEEKDIASAESLTPHSAQVEDSAAAACDEQMGEEQAPIDGFVEHADESAAALVGLSVPLSLEEAFATVDRVVRKSTPYGKARVRLTGLKAKLTGELGHFDEQIYGFKRFKDFLLAAERAGWIKLEASGPVVWVTLPSAPEQEPAKEDAVATNLPEESDEATTEEGQSEARNVGEKRNRTRRRTQPKAKEALVER